MKMTRASQESAKKAKAAGSAKGKAGLAK